MSTEATEAATTAPAPETETTERLEPLLTEADAALRSESILPGLIYNIFLDFRKGESYSGYVEITFRAVKTASLFVDYGGDEVVSITLNGQDLDPVNSRFESKINLDEAILRSDSKINVLRVHFKNRYYKDGNGLHSFIEMDGTQYLYTQSEPFYGCRVFPSFDQPDLKANFILHAATPNDWQVIASVEEQDTSTWEAFAVDDYGSTFYQNLRGIFKDAIPKDHTWWRFQSTVLLPSYLQSAVVGPFVKVDLEEEKRYRGLPMAIWCRQAKLKHAQKQAPTIFEYKKRAIEYYEKTFNMEYQFPKVDTIFCPEFTCGAMEFPGAVTYNERYLPSGENTVKEISDRGTVLLHELVHMWFGNVVTMKWWDGLWLNEAFATFISYHCLDKIKDKLSFETYSGQVIFNVDKDGAYKEDREVTTTHPIAATVPDTQVADNIFDGITYTKGASVLRQLIALVGEDKFWVAAGEYLKSFKFGNSVRQDLLACFKTHLTTDDVAKDGNEKAYDMDYWRETWLETKGYNTIKVAWKAGESKIVLHQGVAVENNEEFSQLRFHRVDVAFFNPKGEVVKVVEAIMKDQAETEITLDTEIGADWVACLPNYRDLSFIKILFDEKSTQWFTENLGLVQELLSQSLILRALFERVLDTQLKASEFIEVVVGLIETQPSNQILDIIYNYIGDCVGFIPPSKGKAIYHNIYAKTRARLIATDDKLLVLSLFKRLISYCFDEEDIDDLKKLLEGSNEDLKGKVELEDDHKWRIIYLIHASSKYDAETKKALFDKQWEADQSNEKKYKKIRIEALSATAEKRAELFKEYLNKDTKMSYKELEVSIRGFTSSFVPEEVRAVYFEEFYANVLQIFKERMRETAGVSRNITFSVRQKFFNQRILNFFVFESVYNYFLDFVQGAHSFQHRRFGANWKSAQGPFAEG